MIVLENGFGGNVNINFISICQGSDGPIKNSSLLKVSY
jgi:hypothetical protein